MEEEKPWWEVVFGKFGAWGKQGEEEQPEEEMEQEEKRTIQNAVLVFGATGRAGRQIVKEIASQEKRDCVLAVRNKEKFEASFNDSDMENLVVKMGIDVTERDTLTNELFTNVTQIVIATGASRGENSSSERVDFMGMENIIDSCKSFLSQNDPGSSSVPLLDLTFPWKRLDDVIMGGGSSSEMKYLPDKGHYEWSGDLVFPSGGFCGTRYEGFQDKGIDLREYDEIRFTVRGTQARFKVNIKTAESVEIPECVYQASFDVQNSEDSEWEEIRLPLRNFVQVNKNRVDYTVNTVPFDLCSIMKTLGFVYSRFEYNEYPNESARDGSFKLQIKDVKLVKATKPRVIFLSSASVERFQTLNEEQRRNDIPIVQLNPGGILNWKYKAEWILRQSGLPYTIIRPCALVPRPEKEEEKALLLSQGDRVNGRVGLREMGYAVRECLRSPSAVCKTFELRRDENSVGRDARDFEKSLRTIATDGERQIKTGLTPFPKARDPPPPLSKEEMEAIVSNIPRASIENSRRSDEEGSASVASDGKQDSENQD